MSPFARFAAASLGFLSKPQIPDFMNKPAAEEERAQISLPTTRDAAATAGAKNTTANTAGKKADLRRMNTPGAGLTRKKKKKLPHKHSREQRKVNKTTLSP